VPSSPRLVEMLTEPQATGDHGRDDTGKLSGTRAGKHTRTRSASIDCPCADQPSPLALSTTRLFRQPFNPVRRDRF
jgi:hypothetical protein